MSLETWKEEFYPVDASEVPESEATQHSLRKWIGLRRENLARHELFIVNGFGTYIHDGENSLDIDSVSCSLCRHYLYTGNDKCDTCPLKLVLGKPCDAAIDSPYNLFCEYYDPEPMIQALSEIDG